MVGRDHNLLLLLCLLRSPVPDIDEGNDSEQLATR
jgi:hypothetical protein